jgi:hypothetical protein
LVPVLYRSHSSLPMTGVMASCAISALLVFMLGLRRTEVVGVALAANAAE